MGAWGRGGARAGGGAPVQQRGKEKTQVAQGRGVEEVGGEGGGGRVAAAASAAASAAAAAATTRGESSTWLRSCCPAAGY